MDGIKGALMQSVLYSVYQPQTYFNVRFIYPEKKKLFRFT